MSEDRRDTGPIGGQMNTVVGGLAERFRIPALVARHSSTSIMGLFALVNGILSIGVMALAALITSSPFVFPSLGPTAFLFFYTPLAPTASPRNTIAGHLIGAGAGYLSLVVFGLTDALPALTQMSLPRVGAAALSLGLTAGLMVWLQVPHPPAGATTLIISLGIITNPVHLVVLMLAVVLLTVQALVINRLAGIGYPVWSSQ